MDPITVNQYELDLNSFYKSSGTTNSLNLLYANIRSLRRNFQNFVAELQQIDSRIHIIVLSEIWVMNDEIDLYKIPGYNIFSCCNDNYRAGGGYVLFI